MKKQVWKFIFLTFATILTTPVVSAQEFIRELAEMKDWHTLIREKKQKEWILYHDYSKKWPTFNIVDPTNTNSPHLAFHDRFLVNDFELLNGEYAYFCGERVNDTGYWQWPSKDWVVVPRRSALVGYFRVDDITSTPLYSPVNCPFLEDFAGVKLKSLDKIEILPVNDGVHLIMTGSTQSGNGCIVDAAASTLFPSTWNVFVDTSSNGEEFDDVAVTGNYIVITSRFPNNQTGHINFFPKPTSYSTSTINSAIFRGMISYSVDDTLLVKHCENDAFVTGTFSYDHNGIVISGYNFTTPIYSIALQNITTLAPELQLKDMSYNNASQTLDVLQNISYGGLLASIVWHLDQTLGSAGTLTNSHFYKDETLHSIVCLKHNPDNTIASGHTRNSSRFALYCQCLLNHHGNCSQDAKTEYTKFNKSLLPDSYQVDEVRGSHCPIHPDAYRNDFQIIDLCPSINNNK
ncbi:MAG: hypothetical protein K6A67_01295 [Bacteroidales bacterium]|nr:hypothetical protein [Bacteroidales bacterium]